MILTTKQEIIKALLQKEAISFEEALILLDQTGFVWSTPKPTYHTGLEYNGTANPNLINNMNPL